MRSHFLKGNKANAISTMPCLVIALELTDIEICTLTKLITNISDVFINFKDFQYSEIQADDK